ncbi:MAG: hypothetical protein HY006_02905 [Candidatus Sungbacteria bacterium]|nr:hypothetical protein [Candidatus Sungbacteria bacterium]
MITRRIKTLAKYTRATLEASVRRVPGARRLVHAWRTRRDSSYLDRARRRALLARKKPLPAPSPEDLQRAEQARDMMRALPAEERPNAAPAEQKWRLFKNELRTSMLTQDLRDFLSWDVISHNMGYGASTKDLRTLQNRHDWDRWHKAMIESPKLNRWPFFALPEVSENSVRQASHLHTFLEASGARLDDFDRIIDFGGGYGAMCRLVFRLGFRGQYVIIDWPEFSILETYYLGASGLDMPITRANEPVHTGIVLVNTIKELNAVRSAFPTKRECLIATWSISETPVSFRDTFFQAIEPQAFFIVYQKSFGGIDNEEYFSRLMKRRSDVKWSRIRASYLPSEGNYYLIGMRPLT